MPTTAPRDAFPDDRDTIAFARVPEALDEQERQRTYDRPLTTLLPARAAGAFLRGFSDPGDPTRPAWVGLEARLAAPRNLADFCACLRDLGAPPETRIEYETRDVTLEFTLAELPGR